MAAVTLTEQADCLVALGQLDAAAEKYEEAIVLDEKNGNLFVMWRSVRVNWQMC